ncbi:tRNA dihydrouridine synthase DusB [Aminicella lysinilytica]|uniref:tRNA dihydrouridine synthase DusB n=1 Tax=Aminicella lysinilytica TaxID=433323 RepID=UPI0026F23580|nr:tRNA dihydrouridine synthase DusB [Aminicella lysinilytica]
MSNNIGNLNLDDPFILAPLAGITDAPMRRICGRLGASLTYSEMVSAKGLYYGDKKTERLLFIYPDEGPVAYQLFGRDPEIMAFAAEKLDDRPNAIFDINMGCPVPKVVKNGEGSALLKEPALIEKLVAAAVTHTSKPVTAKIRIGFGAEKINAVEVAKAVEAGGASAVAVHGRTREQFYTGKANWDVIADVKAAVNIPVIGNGDVVDWPSASALMSQTGCDLVMIGRGALGNPWIFRDLLDGYLGRPASPAPTVEDKKNMMLTQLSDIVDLKGEYVAVREMRKICGWYLKGVPGSAAFRGKINGITDVRELEAAIRGI